MFQAFQVRPSHAAGRYGDARTGIDRSGKLAFKGSSISSYGGLLLHREPDDAHGLTDMAAIVADPRIG